MNQVIKMSNRKIKFTPEQQQEIKETRAKNNNKNVERRLCVLVMKIEGPNISEIAARTGYNPTYARSLVTKYFAKGLGAIVGKKRPGNNRNMSFEAEVDFVNGLAQVQRLEDA